MYINPLHVINEGWLQFPAWMDEAFKQKCIQPNAIDITIDKVFDYKDRTAKFLLSEEEKIMRPMVEQSSFATYFNLNPGASDIMSDFYVSIPAGVAAFLIVRSTLNRNGLFVTSGLYDQGFSNNIGFVIHNTGPVAFIAPHTRVAQIVFVKSEDSGILYDGAYNNNQGEHWSSSQH